MKCSTGTRSQRWFANWYPKLMERVDADVAADDRSAGRGCRHVHRPSMSRHEFVALGSSLAAGPGVGRRA
jgi:hypothetical protein